MAYGLDFEELYYTDHGRTDIGVLDTYKISLDLADEKNFSLETPYFLMAPGNFWYAPDTEFGGIIDSYETDSETEKVTYEGRSFRGILDKHIIDKNMLVQGQIKNICNSLINTCGLSNFIVCDDPDVDETINTSVNSYTVVFGTTLYEALMKISATIELNLLFRYRPKDKKIHLIPILSQDYTDYLMYSDVGDTFFTLQIDEGVPNHLILTGIEEETKQRRTIHLFTDSGGQFRPFSTKTVKLVDTGNEETLCYEENGVLQPLEDSMYILDKRNRVLSGVDEITELVESTPTISEKYKKLFSAPANWTTVFGQYYYLNREIDETTGEVTSESWEHYEVIENPPVYEPLRTKPADWNTNYSNYYERSYNQETGEYEYNTVSAETELDYSQVFLQKTQPNDWKYKYDEYYYYLQPKTKEQLTQYSGVSHTSFIKLKSKPLDWDANVTSYYKKAYREVDLKKKSKKERKKLIKDCVKYKDAYYKSLEIPKGKKTIKFVANKYYRSDSYTTPPKFQSGNTYHVKTRVIIPTFSSVLHFRQKITYSAPPFVSGEVHQLIEDHYESLVLDGLGHLDDLQKSSSQQMILENYDVNIGDTVGGRDEFTGTVIVKEVTNIEVTIESGLMELNYVVNG